MKPNVGGGSEANIQTQGGMLQQLKKTLIGVVQQQATTGNDMTRLMEQQQQQMRQGGSQQGPQSGISELKRLTPPAFKGATDPLESKKWVTKMEKVFEVLGCSDARKGSFVAFVLQGSAYDW